MDLKATYEQFGYQNCQILSPDEVAAIDPYLADFCEKTSELDKTMQRNWKKRQRRFVAPGGCIDTHVFLPKFYEYLQKSNGKHSRQLSNEI